MPKRTKKKTTKRGTAVRSASAATPRSVRATSLPKMGALGSLVRFGTGARARSARREQDVLALVQRTRETFSPGNEPFWLSIAKDLYCNIGMCLTVLSLDFASNHAPPHAREDARVRRAWELKAPGLARFARMGRSESDRRSVLALFRCREHVVREASRAKCLIGAVARVFAPGCKVDCTPILEGAQGIGKSTAIRALASDAFFFDTPIDMGHKDSYQALHGKWIAELSELDSLNRTEVNRAKAFTTTAIVRCRSSRAFA